MKITLKQVRDQLYTAVVPNLSTQEYVDKFNLTLNLACERIINDGSWLGCYEHVGFLISAGQYHLTLPPEYASVEAMAYERQGQNGCVCSVPVQIRNEWNVLLAGGPFLWNQGVWGNYGFQAYNSFANDRGDGFVTFRDSPYAVYTLRFELESSEDAGKVVLVKGFNEDGDKIFSPGSSNSFEGIEFTLSYPNTTPAQQFTKQLYFLYKEAFEGYLKLYAVEDGTGEETLIGNYQPNDTNPDYKRYGIPNCNCNTEFTVRTICKRRFVPVFHDQDSVFPANLGALRTALTAIVYESQNDPGRRDTEMAQAVNLLNNELRSFRGGAAMKLRIDVSAFNAPGLYPGP